MSASITTPGPLAVNGHQRSDGTSRSWLDVILTINRIVPDTFGTPDLRREPVYTEVYPDFTVTFADDLEPDDALGPVTITATGGKRAEALLVTAAEELGLAVKR